ncbi:unnamed protein product, partial [Mesorhabditis spiculigera]
MSEPQQETRPATDDDGFNRDLEAKLKIAGSNEEQPIILKMKRLDCPAALNFITFIIAEPPELEGTRN